MCTGRSQNSNSSEQEQEQAGSWQQLYPDLAQMFAGTTTEQTQEEAAPSLMAHITNLLGIQPQHFNTQQQQQHQHFNTQQQQQEQHQHQHQNPEPSAPPPPPTPDATSGFTPPPTWQTPNQCNCNCQNHQQSPLSLLLTPLLNFSTRLTKHFLAFFSIVLLLLTISLLPSCFMSSFLYLGLGTGLGLHLPTLFAGHILHSIVSLVNPFFACLLVLGAAHKMFIRRQPLFNSQTWRRRWSNSRHHWANARQQWAGARQQWANASQQWANASQHCYNARQ